MRITPAKYARVREVAAQCILNGVGIVPDDSAEFNEPIYRLAKECFGFQRTLDAVRNDLEALGLPLEDYERIDGHIIELYDDALTVGYIFGVAVGLQMAGGLAPVKTKKAGRR